MPLSSPPAKEATQTAFRLSIEGQLERLPHGVDPITELDRIHQQLSAILQKAPVSAPDPVHETRHRAFLAAQLAAAVDEIKARYGRREKRLAG